MIVLSFALILWILCLSFLQDTDHGARALSSGAMTFDTDFCGVTGVLGGFGAFSYNFIAALQVTIKNSIVLFPFKMITSRKCPGHSSLIGHYHNPSTFGSTNNSGAMNLN